MFFFNSVVKRFESLKVLNKFLIILAVRRATSPVWQVFEGPDVLQPSHSMEETEEACSAPAVAFIDSERHQH